MADRKVFLEVVTPERTVLQEEAASVIVPGMQGYIGIQYNHAPMVVGLRPGVLMYGDINKEKKRVAVSGGFAEVSNNRVTVLADAAERAEEIDVERARAARERAERRLRDYSSKIDHVRAELALHRALARLQAAGVRTSK